MKAQVIFKEELNPKPRIVTYNNIAAIQSENKFYLKLESAGYIFRVNNDIFGHSGHHKTPDEACYYAVSTVPSTTILEFDSPESREKWLRE